MIIPKRFYAGFPYDGGPATQGTNADGRDVTLWDLGVGPSGFGTLWRIESLFIVNPTQAIARISVGIWPLGFNRNVQPLMSQTVVYNAVTLAYANPPIGPLLAYSQPIPAQTSRVIPVDAYMIFGEHLAAGAMPGGSSLSQGAVSLIISGREYKD